MSFIQINKKEKYALLNCTSSKKEIYIHLSEAKFTRIRLECVENFITKLLVLCWSRGGSATVQNKSGKSGRLSASCSLLHLMSCFPMSKSKAETFYISGWCVCCVRRRREKKVLQYSTNQMWLLQISNTQFAQFSFPV